MLHGTNVKRDKLILLHLLFLCMTVVFRYETKFYVRDDAENQSYISAVEGLHTFSSDVPRRRGSLVPFSSASPKELQ